MASPLATADPGAGVASRLAGANQRLDLTRITGGMKAALPKKHLRIMCLPEDAMWNQIDSEALSQVTGGGARINAAKSNVEMMGMLLQQHMQLALAQAKSQAS